MDMWPGVLQEWTGLLLCIRKCPFKIIDSVPQNVEPGVECRQSRYWYAFSKPYYEPYAF